MTTMIDRKPRTATGGPSSTPIVTVSMYGAAEDDANAMNVDHVEILPTLNAEDATAVFTDTVERMVASFAEQNVAPEYAPIRADATGYRKVSFTTPSGSIVAVEKF